MSRECIYIIDTFSLMFQVFHAIPAMTGTRGQPTNAVFGFTRDIYAILDRKPGYLVCAIDSPGPGKREEIFDRYKANRTEIPEDLRPQIPLIKQLLECFRIPGIECPQWEADDVIATLTNQALARDLDVVIVSTDKDARQLLGPHVRMLNCRRNEFYNEASLQEDWGIRPDQVVDFQSLVGDSVDNVPGVPKIGPKTARTLIEQFGTLENILANAGRAPGKKVQENLAEFAGQALMSRELVRLRQDLPITIDLEAARVSAPDYPALHRFFVDMGFRRYAAQVRDHVGVGGDESGGEMPDSVAESVSAASGTPGEQASEVALPITSADQLSQVLGEFVGTKLLAVEPLLTGTTVRGRRITGAVFSGGSQSYAIDSAAVTASDLTNQFLQWLAGYSGEVLIASAKGFCHALRNVGAALPQRFFDLSIADYLLDAGARGHELSDIVERYGKPA
ncbi:MAG: polymerase, partial [Planctomycetota bacterium]